MITVNTKINGSEAVCITDVGEIFSMPVSGEPFTMDGGYAEFSTSEGDFLSLSKRNFVLCCGCIGVKFVSNFRCYCSDPRIIMMYLWKLRQELFEQPVTEPPIPTREEAVEWLKEMDIPLEPQEEPREWTPKTKRNFLNEKG